MAILAQKTGGPEDIGGLEAKPPGKISKIAPLDLREMPFYYRDTPFLEENVG